ncbi:MAG TPA: hypothetical protein VNM90_17325, partial [Haliangium sp.]|nr:hypothetical protein [Haliangium sp.]
MNRFAVTPFLFCSLLALSVAACGDDGNNGEDPDAMVPPGQPDAMEEPTPDAAPVPPDAAPPPTPEIVVSSTTLTVNEGAAGAEITIKLSASPGTNLAVAIASSDEGAAAATPGSISFTDADYATEQTLTVTAPNDADGNNETLTLTLSGTGLADVTVDVTVIDDDSLNILAEPTTITVDEGGDGTFGVSLTVQPNADVTVNVVSGNEGKATVDLDTLTFTPANYDQAQ